MFSKGDKVRIRDEAYLRQHHSETPGVVGRMFDHAGTEQTVRHVYDLSPDKIFYDLVGVGGVWRDNWLDPVFQPLSCDEQRDLDDMLQISGR